MVVVLQKVHPQELLRHELVHGDSFGDFPIRIVHPARQDESHLRLGRHGVGLTAQTMIRGEVFWQPAEACAMQLQGLIVSAPSPPHQISPPRSQAIKQDALHSHHPAPELTVGDVGLGKAAVGVVIGRTLKQKTAEFIQVVRHPGVVSKIVILRERQHQHAFETG